MECPRYGERESSSNLRHDDPLTLMKEMEESSGLKLSKGAKASLLNLPASALRSKGAIPENQKFVVDEEQEAGHRHRNSSSKKKRQV